MSGFKAKMHQIRFSPDLKLYLTGLLLRRERGKGGEGKRKGRKGNGVGRGDDLGEIWPTQKFWSGAPYGTLEWYKNTSDHEASAAVDRRQCCFSPRTDNRTIVGPRAGPTILLKCRPAKLCNVKNHNKPVGDMVRSLV